MHVLVTGANGHVGSNLCRALIARGHRVRASVRSPADPARTAHLAGLPGLELIGLEVRDAAQFAAATRDIDVLYHTAATYALYTGSLEQDEALVRDASMASRTRCEAPPETV